MGSANGAPKDSRGPPSTIAGPAGAGARSASGVASASIHSVSKKDSAVSAAAGATGGKDLTFATNDGQAKERRYDQRRESLGLRRAIGFAIMVLSGALVGTLLLNWIMQAAPHKLQVSPQQTEAENEAEHELATMGIKVGDEGKSSTDKLTSGVEGIVQDSKEGAKAVMEALVDQFMVAGGTKTAKKTVLRRGEMCVLGPPGGGTSSVASILFLAGGNLGPQESLVFRDKSKVSKINAMKGFLSAYSTFEHKNVLNLNRNILHAMGHDELNKLSHFNSSIANLNSTQVSSFRANATNILNPLRASGRPTVIADYRLSLTFGVWRPLLQDPTSVLIVLNHPAVTMRALQEDHGIPADRAGAVWELYVTESMRTTAGMRRTIVALEELLANPQENVKVLLELLALWGIQGLQLPNKWESLQENIAPGILKPPTEEDISRLSSRQLFLYHTMLAMSVNFNATAKTNFQISSQMIAGGTEFWSVSEISEEAETLLSQF